MWSIIQYFHPYLKAQVKDILAVNHLCEKCKILYPSRFFRFQKDSPCSFKNYTVAGRNSWNVLKFYSYSTNDLLHETVNQHTGNLFYQWVLQTNVSERNVFCICSLFLWQFSFHCLYLQNFHTVTLGVLHNGKTEISESFYLYGTRLWVPSLFLTLQEPNQLLSPPIHL